MIYVLLTALSRFRSHARARVYAHRSFSATLHPGVGEYHGVYHISNTCVPAHNVQRSRDEGSSVFLSGSTWEDITISLGRPLSGSGVGFALDSHSATKVDRRTLFYQDGWRGLSLFPRVRRAEGPKGIAFRERRSRGRRSAPDERTAGSGRAISSVPTYFQIGNGVDKAVSRFSNFSKSQFPTLQDHREVAPRRGGWSRISVAAEK